MKALTIALAVVALPLAAARADEPKREGEPNLVSVIGMSVEAGGGAGGFIDQHTNDTMSGSPTKAQGIWTAKLTLGTRSHFGGELGYIGAAQGLGALGVQDKAVLVANGVESAFRFNVLTGMWQPYATVGIAYKHYTVTNTSTNTSDVKTDSDVAEFPVALGLAFRYSGFIADARVSVNPAANSDLLANSSGSPAHNVSTWNAGARIGFEF